MADPQDYNTTEHGDGTAASLPSASPGPELQYFSQRADGSHEYTHIIAQGSSRVHAGNSNPVENHNYYFGAANEQGNERKNQERLQDEREFRDTLAFPEMSMRSANIGAPQARTCEWLFDTTEYKSWRNPESRAAHHGILWIKGKPGAGKSTIMKHVLHCTQKLQGDNQVISFFFNARGSGLEKRTEGMYRTLLHQTPKDLPTLRGMSERSARRRYKLHGWPLELLKDMFREAVLQITRETALTCYVDALDECDEDEIRDMLVLFEDLGSATTEDAFGFSVCFASRHYPKITIGHLQELMLDDVEDHKKDISLYVQRRLRLKHAAFEQELAAEIEQKSSGVFLWVVLVVRLINKTSDHGNIHYLQEQLRRLPTSLQDLFSTILERGEPNENLVPMMQWSLFSHRPLTAIELYFAVMASTGQFSAAMELWDKALLTGPMICDFIVTSSMGFIEVRENEDVTCLSCGLSYGFIHETVREYFLSHGLRKLNFTLGHHVVASSHERLARYCIVYALLFRVKRAATGAEEDPFAPLTEVTLDNVPFLGYVRDFGAFYHAEEADRGGIPQDDFWVRFPLSKWVSLYALGPGRDVHACKAIPLRPNFRPIHVSLHQRSFTLLHALVDLGYENMVKLMLQRYNVGASAAGRRYIGAPCGTIGTALHIAIDHDNTSMIDILLAGGACIDTCDKYLGTPLNFAILRNKTSCIRALLEYGTSKSAWNAHDLIGIMMSAVKKTWTDKSTIQAIADYSSFAETTPIELLPVLSEAIRHCDQSDQIFQRLIPLLPAATLLFVGFESINERVEVLRQRARSRDNVLQVLLQILPTTVFSTSEYQHMIQAASKSEQSEIQSILKLEKARRDFEDMGLSDIGSFGGE